MVSSLSSSGLPQGLGSSLCNRSAHMCLLRLRWASQDLSVLTHQAQFYLSTEISNCFLFLALCLQSRLSLASGFRPHPLCLPRACSSLAGMQLGAQRPPQEGVRNVTPRDITKVGHSQVKRVQVRNEGEKRISQHLSVHRLRRVFFLVWFCSSLLGFSGKKMLQLCGSCGQKSALNWAHKKPADRKSISSQRYRGGRTAFRRPGQCWA